MLQMSKQQQAFSASGSSWWHQAWRPPDLSCARFNIAANITNMFTDELFTDAKVVVEGRVWHVHRAMLASASPILKDAFLCGEHMTPTTLCHVHKCVFPWQLREIIISRIL